jgi:predicted MFS family arabinose efflux permease
LSVFFDIANQSHLPTLVRREELVEGNSKLSASASVAEFGAFGAGGWLVQWLTAPYAIVVDAATFLWSAFFVVKIETPEPPPAPVHERQHVVREIEEGLRFVLGHATLHALATSSLVFNCAIRIFGTVFLLYVTRDLGFKPGVLGVIFAMGGISSLLGALVAGRVTGRIGIGPALIASFVLVALGNGLIPIASDASLIAVAFLVAQQFITDPAWTVMDISQVSLRQSITPDRWQGRTNASMRVVEFGGMLFGALIGGWLGGAIGLRATLIVASVACAAAGLPLLLSSVRSLRVAEPVAPTLDQTITEVP